MNIPFSESGPGVAGGGGPGAGPITRAAVWAIAAYTATQLLADIASLKIGVVGGWAVDLGTFIFPVSFTLRDVVHKSVGRKRARDVILAAAGMNLVMALYLHGCMAVPPAPDWGLDEAFRAVLAPVWRIVAASILAQVAGQIVNTEIYHLFMARVTRRHQWLRVLTSNTAGIPVDTALFVLAAFGGTLPGRILLEIFVFNLAVKWGVGLFSLPLIYLVRGRDED